MTVPVPGQFKDSLMSPGTGAGKEGGSFLPWEMMISEVVNTVLSLQGGEAEGQSGAMHLPPPPPHTPPLFFVLIR